ncbi:MAG TPA: RES family NAD+ phosphorylase [Vicinamibacterales bacterium]|nr:RES family NAD+ phosphorylase [Vicinamibacterales bacterium]
MSSSIWTQSAASCSIAPFAAEPWRVVEAQHRIATRKLVDSDREQAILEDLLESAKPPLSEGGKLHYLLFTPFRYPPLPHGSRFGSRWEPGLWYGSEALPTAFAEVAYYRLLFLDGTDADLGAVETDLSAFHVPVATARGIDLTVAPFDRWRPSLASKVSYAVTQPLGAAMREAGVEAFRYVSARDAAGRPNVALFTARGFAARRPRALQTWHSIATRASVEFAKLDYFERQSHRFAREAFLVRGVMPHPAVP